LSKKSSQHVSAALKSWAVTENWSARTANARNTFEARFLKQAGGDPKRAEMYRRAYYIDLGRKSAAARAARRGDAA
jgi:hypothetical protein